MTIKNAFNSLTIFLLSGFVVGSIPSTTWAVGKSSALDSFLTQIFGNDIPKAHTVKLSATDKSAIEDILQHALSFQRVRCWKKDNSSLWVLNEIGKHKPITAAFWLEKNTIKQAKVLAFRESRGWEIKYPYFLKQFAGASLQESLDLSEKVDGISGATLSVRAMEKMARIALYLNQQTATVQSQTAQLN